jgi:hypothetical protein
MGTKFHEKENNTLIFKIAKKKYENSKHQKHQEIVRVVFPW